MKNLLKTFLTMALVVPTVNVASAATVNSCSKSGFTIGLTVKGSRNKFDFTKNPVLNLRDAHFKTWILEQLKKDAEKFNTERGTLLTDKQNNNVQYASAGPARNMQYHNIFWAYNTALNQAKDVDYTDNRQMLQSHGFTHVAVVSKKAYTDPSNGRIIPGANQLADEGSYVHSAIVGTNNVASHAAIDDGDYVILVPVSDVTINSILINNQNGAALKLVNVAGVDAIATDKKNVIWVDDTNAAGTILANTHKVEPDTYELLYTDDGTLFNDVNYLNYMQYDAGVLTSNGYKMFGALASTGIVPGCVQRLEAIYNGTSIPDPMGAPNATLTQAIRGVENFVSVNDDLGKSFEEFFNSSDMVKNVNAIVKAKNIGELNLNGAKGEYNAFSGMSFGLELNLGWTQRFGDFAFSIGAAGDIPLVKKTAEINDAGIAESNNNDNNNNNADNKNNDNKDKKSESNDYGLSITAKPSIGIDVNGLYNLTRNFSLGGGCTVWYKRYDVKTNKMSSLYLADDKAWDGVFVSEFKEVTGISLDDYNKDIKATGIANESIAAKAWVLEPYIKAKYDISNRCGITVKVGIPLKKKIVKTASDTIGDITTSGFNAGIGISYTV